MGSVLATLNLVVNFTKFHHWKPLQESLRIAFQFNLSEDQVRKIHDIFHFIKQCFNVLTNYLKLGGLKQRKCILYTS